MRNMLRAIVLAAVVACVTVPAQAQTECAVNCMVMVGQKFTAFTEVLPDGTNYMLMVDGVGTSIPGHFVNGMIEFDHPGFTTKGSHALEIRVMVNGQWLVLTEPFSLSVVRRNLKIRG